MKILCTICCRSGSKGLRNKNIKLLNGYPLISYTIKQAQKSKLFDKIGVSSDSIKILNIAKSCKVDFTLKRKKKLSLDKTSKVLAIQDLMIKSEQYFKSKFDYIVDLDVTSPLRKIQDIKNSINKIIKENNDVLFSVTRAKKNPYFNMVEYKNHHYQLVKKLNRITTCRQNAPLVYEMNASIYIWRRNFLRKPKKNYLFSQKNSIYEMPFERSIDIDSLADFKIVKALI